MSFRFLNALVLSIMSLVSSALASAEVQTFTATHTYILGDRDSKDDARQRCLLETKRKILEQAGVYIESASEVKDFELTKDKITSFAAAVMQVKDTREEVAIQQGHMSLTLTTTAQVDLEEVRKQLAARQADTGVRDTVAAQQERLKHLEAQLEAMQQQMQVGHVPGRTPVSPPSDISSAYLQTLRTRAAQGDAGAQGLLGLHYANGSGVPQDYGQARLWWERAAAQGYASSQVSLGLLYANGSGVPQDYGQARLLWERAAAQGDASAQIGLGALHAFGRGVPQDYERAYMWYSLAVAYSSGAYEKKLAAKYRYEVAQRMTPAQIAEAQRLSQQCQARQFKGC